MAIVAWHRTRLSLSRSKIFRDRSQPIPDAIAHANRLLNLEGFVIKAQFTRNFHCEANGAHTFLYIQAISCSIHQYGQPWFKTFVLGNYIIYYLSVKRVDIRMWKTKTWNHLTWKAKSAHVTIQDWGKAMRKEPDPESGICSDKNVQRSSLYKRNWHCINLRTSNGETKGRVNIKDVTNRKVSKKIFEVQDVSNW